MFPPILPRPVQQPDPNYIPIEDQLPPNIYQDDGDDNVVPFPGTSDTPDHPALPNACESACNRKYQEQIRKCNSEGCTDNDQRLQCVDFAKRTWNACITRCRASNR